MTPRRMQKPEVSSLRDAVLEIDSLIEPGTAAQPVELSGEAWDRLVSLATAEINDRKLSMQSSVDVLEFDRELEALREFRDRVRLILNAAEARNDSSLCKQLETWREIVHAPKAAPPVEELKASRSPSFQPDNFRPAALRMLDLPESAQDYEFFDALRALVRRSAHHLDPNQPNLSGEELTPAQRLRAAADAVAEFSPVPPPLKPKRQRKPKAVKLCEFCGTPDPRGDRHGGAACGIVTEQVDLDEMIESGRRPPGRPTKKFPRGGSSLTEKCTECGRELGEHDGTECPVPSPVPEVTP